MGKEIRFVSYDIETTGNGFKPEQSDITQIAAIKYSYDGNNLVEIERYESLIYTEQQLSQWVLENTTIRTEQLMQAPRIEVIKEEFLNFVGDHRLIAHNGKAFDDPNIEYHFDIKLNNPIDSMLYAKQKLRGYNGKYNLKDLSIHLGHGYCEESHHDATYDAELAAKVFISLLEIKYN